MKRLFLIFAVVVVSATAVSCGDFFEDFFDNQEGVEDTENIDDGVQSEEELRASFEYERYLKHVNCYGSISYYPGELDYASLTLLYLISYKANFFYDEYGRPLTVEQNTTDPKQTDLSKITTLYEFAYPGNTSAQLREMRTDYDLDGNISYTYKDEFSTFRPYNCFSEYSNSYLKMFFMHDEKERIVSAEVGYYAFVHYDFTYDRIGRMENIEPAYFPSVDEIYDGRELNFDVNVDYNVLLLTTDFMDYSYQNALPLFLRMGGKFGDQLMCRYFSASGGMGGGYVIALPEEYAGKTVHQEGYIVAYNENWEGAPVSYVIEDGYVTEMHIYLPVTLYKHEYDAKVSNELLYSDYPESGYRVESVSNETQEKLESCTVEYIYEFSYYTKEEILNK